MCRNVTSQSSIRTRIGMDDVQRFHDVLLQQRTQIRHHSSIAHWMKRCWQTVPHADQKAMVLDEFEDMYSILLYEMTICWEEELNDAILAKMWRRDAGSHTTLNFDRFSCSLFYFIEMWVEEITLVEYEKIFGHVYRLLSELDQTQPRVSPLYAPRTFKPTLESFNNALDNEKAMEELQMNFGKSISFNAQQYYQHFGTPTTHLQAFQATLLHLQSRVYIEPNDSVTTRRQSMRDSRKFCTGLQSSQCHEMSATRINPPGTRPTSPQRQTTSSVLSPHSASRRSRYALALTTDPPSTRSSPSPSPDRFRTVGEPFLLIGKSMLRSSQSDQQ